ncbi:hypothetical protein BGX28_000878 [Mortierella sp. GBA30]|nr:hypothetical protein BGX28_000878 [Mortierella sp. GBA30]
MTSTSTAKVSKDECSLEPEVASLSISSPAQGLIPRGQEATQLEESQRDLGVPHNNPNEVDSVLQFIQSIKQLPTDEAQWEEERAAEKIKQKLKPHSKLSSYRSTSEAMNKNDDTSARAEILTSDDDEQISGIEGSVRASSVEGPRTSISSISGESNSGIRSAVGSVVDSIAKVRQKNKKISTMESLLIELEPPKLVDAQTAIGDRRYFKSSGDPEPEGDFVYDFLYQHQRGAFFLGTPRFSSKSLLPVDPDEWTDQFFEASAMDTSDYGLPDPSWEWVHKSWLVDMTGDVDEDGWEYAMTFHGSPWHGNYEVFRSFARRRRWLRLRKRKGKTLSRPGPLPERKYPSSVHSATWTRVDASPLSVEDSSPFPQDDEDSGGGVDEPKGSDNLSVPVDLYKVLKKARSDREKLAYTAQYVVRYPGDLEDLRVRLDKYLNLLDYETSRREFLALLAVYSPAEKDAVLMAAEHLEFYSDKKRLQETCALKGT